jgi:hypothetical protein
VMDEKNKMRKNMKRIMYFDKMEIRNLIES